MGIGSAATALGRRSGTGIGWAVGGTLVAAMVTLGALLTSPALVPGVVAAVAAIYVAAFHPKAFALLGVVAIALSTLASAVVGAVAGYIDEAVVLLAVAAFTTRRLVTRGRLVPFPGMLWFGAFVLFGVVSAVVQDVPLAVGAEALLLITKGLLFAFALAQLEWTEEDLHVLTRAGVGAFVVLALTGAVNLLAPGLAASFSGGVVRTGVGGLPALTGIFDHPAAYGRFCAIIAVGAMAYGLVVRRSVGNIALVVGATALAALTFQVKSIVGLLVALVVIGVRFIRPVTALAALAIGPLVVLAMAPPLAAFVGADVEQYVLQDSARSTLTVGSVDVAGEYFPLGAGFGRYGSFPAGENYSPEYAARDFDQVYGLGRDENGMFLNDTQWPAIIGETGWLGAAAFALGVVAVLVSLFRRTSSSEPHLVRWIRITGVGWLVLLLTESIAGPVFVSAPSYPFVFAAAGIVAAFRDGAREAGISVRSVPGALTR